MKHGHFVLIDPDLGELRKVRAVPGDRAANERIRRDLLRDAGEGCFVDFRPDEAED